MIKITSDQWELYLKKYNKLMWAISHRISGDSMIASLEDNYSDLSIAAIESINGFHKKTGKTFDEMIQMKLFDQYTKTCLWTAKARKGVKLTERMPFRKKHISLNAIFEDKESDFDVPDTSATARYAMIDAKDMRESYNPEVNKLISFLEDNPKLMTSSGDLKLKPIADLMQVTPKEVLKMMKIIEDKND